MVGTVERGVRSEVVVEEKVRREAGRGTAVRGGDEDRIWVDEVGRGVGYLETMPWFSRATRFCGRGRDGDELNGSKAGNRDAGRLRPAREANEAFLGGDDESMITKASRAEWLYKTRTSRQVVSTPGSV